CLQGGAEFGPACAEIDRLLLGRSTGPVVLVPLAVRSGYEFRTTAADGVRWYRELGADQVSAIPDVRTESGGLAAAESLLAEAGLVVLPGGSPGRLLEVLTATRLDAALAQVLARGGTVSGASAGAMVLCERTIVPEPGPARLVAGLGIVPGVCVIPHYRGSAPEWLRTVELPARIRALGVPECTGVLVDGSELRWIGPEPAVFVGADGAAEPVPPLG
ncbi:MAG TPA: Type 1 glutamine amidotransferase-like domain-containing protein, partial [Actinomycetes bacterium]|nr:Type 1 glutamine amidotransferase-like domain-containing protein [Actinomycetes bacterium]